MGSKMKKLFVFISLVLLNISIFAQSPISEGVYTISGSISYSSQSYDQVSNSDNTFSFNPQLGYFFIDNLYTALSLNYMNHSFNSTSQNYYGIGPALRYYFEVEKIKPFLGLSFIYNKQTGNNGIVSISSTEWKISGGADYFITKSFALEASLNYSFLNFKLPQGIYSSNTSNSKIFQLGIGVNYFIY